MQGMQRVFSAPHIGQVELAKRALELEGINPTIRNSETGTLAGGLPVGECWVELWVENKDAAAATKILEPLRADRPVDSQPRFCVRCKAELDAEIAVCWSCGAQQPGAEFEELPPAEPITDPKTIPLTGPGKYFLPGLLLLLLVAGVLWLISKAIG